MQQREDLINQLAASMGAGSYAQTKYEESRYDPETGTLYCNGQMITKNKIDLAERYYKTMLARCDLKTPEGRQMAAIYQVGLEGIKKIRSTSSKG